ncbi:lysine--tRNA ligase [Kamptonema sp. UHCC 0994]|uniref:lysine--tRNA ligase n=1 Tax=Kamptonema sp. UHCC 0994 TaxID=3031329 RepID=UPI0023B98246|nr:lysine--tRNA ligase [Kamptonema sp. UHCC 0994]MDF0554845.1 lysine--tRNA ligase [Kamptonema sp. UHCC 0994]
MSLSEAEVRSQKIDELRSQGIEPYPSESYARSHTAKDVHELFSQPGKELQNGETDPEEISLRVCGRITSKRDSGSICFIDLKDFSDKIQLKIEKKIVTGESGLSFKQVQKLLDVGDFVGVEGIGCRTPRGELSILVRELKVLSKATIPFPDAYYGVNDPEICRRHREMDLAGNPESFKRFILRSRIVQSIRSYFWNTGFHELETPTLQAIYGGGAARPFITHHNALDVDFYLRIATELFLKRAVAGGFERVFEVGRIFRNEGVDSTHNPEFTSLEAYLSYADYFDILEVVEEVICYAANSIFGDVKEIENQGKMISLERKFDYSEEYPGFSGKHWQLKTMIASVKDETGLDFESLNLEDAIAAAEKLELHLSNLEKQSLGYLLYAVFDNLVVPKLIQPTFIMDFPVEVSPLAKRHRSKPGFVERFELFINGTEYSNGFSELNDPKEQRKRFEEQLAQRKAGDDEAHPMDEDFIQGLSLGMPNCAGVGIGIDRLVMLLTNTQSIRDVVMFPTMRPAKDS